MNQYDLAYALGGCLSAPLWIFRSKSRKKVFNALSTRMGHISPRTGSAKAIMIHAVSLGEINATRQLVAKLRIASPGTHFIITATTDTGSARANELYGQDPDVTLVRYPLDFSWAVTRLLDNLHPSVVVLMELEVWPNFLAQCNRRQIPVVLINGRLTTASYKRYRAIKPLAKHMFSRLAKICVQDEEYARRFVELGSSPQRVSVTGTMKFDTATVLDSIAGTEQLATSVALHPKGNQLIWVCGSTGPGEEELIVHEYRRLINQFPNLRLVIVPRHPERFDQVAALIHSAGFPCLRRTNPSPQAHNPLPPIILGDTMGELRAWYSLADIVFVGRSLVDLGPRQHGSDMIEPAALAKPTIVGPFTANFAEPMNRFLAHEAMKVVNDPEQLREQIANLLNRPAQAASLGQRAKEVVQREQGATDRHVQAILACI